MLLTTSLFLLIGAWFLAVYQLRESKFSGAGPWALVLAITAVILPTLAAVLHWPAK